MMPIRRGFKSTAIIILIAAAAAPGHSQNYPTRPVRLVVPNAPGSSGDIVARLIAPPLSERLGQPVIVDNRAGAGTMIGGEVVAKSPPDGYTLLMGLSTLAINPAIFKQVPYDALRDFAPIMQLISLPALILSHPSLPVRSVKELIALGRARPDAIAFASTGPGTFSHATTALLMSMGGIRMLHVPYKGTGPALAATLSGEAALTSLNVLSTLPHVRSGRLRALAITSSTRAAVAREIPTVAEGGLPGYESVQWIGLLAPAGTPPAVVERIYRETTTILRAPEIRQRLAADGAETVESSPTAFGAYIRSETMKWPKALKSAELRP